MTRILEGKPSGKGLRFAVVVGRFNSFITDKLLEGALAALQASGVPTEDVEVVRVPGSFEIPQAAKKMAASGKFHAVVCLGTIIKGETPHWDYLSQAVSHGLARAALQTDVPFSFGVSLKERRTLTGAEHPDKGNPYRFDVLVGSNVLPCSATLNWHIQQFGS